MTISEIKERIEECMEEATEKKLSGKYVNAEFEIGYLHGINYGSYEAETSKEYNEYYEWFDKKMESFVKLVRK